MCTNNCDYKGSDEIIASAMGRRNLLKTNAFVLHGMVLQASSVQLFNTKMVLESQDLFILQSLCCLGDLFIR